MTVILALLFSCLGLAGWIGVVSCRALREPPLTGAEGLALAEGVVKEWSGEDGWVLVDGELWRASSENALAPGDRVDVLRQDGLMLEVGWARRRLGHR